MLCHSGMLSCNEKVNVDINTGIMKSMMKSSELAESFSAMFTNRSASSGDSPFAVLRLCVWNMGRAKRVSYK